MIDRSKRNEAISALEAYLGDEITAFEFDDRIHDIESDDLTVIEVVHALWFHYDDCTDHKMHLSKQEWDYFQRLLLILRSDAELEFSRQSRWSWDHALAWLAALGFGLIAIGLGWGWHLLIWSVPFGIISICISLYRKSREPEPTSFEIACMPFQSVSQIRALRDRVPEFKKRPYRNEIGKRRVRHPAQDSFHWAFCHAYWILLGPAALFFQGFPSQHDDQWNLQMP
ncbi:hypothetical protein JO972_07250 [Verrucomicrobiaceae bacterium 5K15]|uniref:Uncharacterized protein n=1 Tax=Oceaniferula flava TaxID=2800421 RepID=A0AAE2SBL2_9BACT|nr:hypothetical protein [Oceaniferula flavus]MBK1854749.1 hypothetical protein [Oceaniferula flavus]MBM1136055.1 hypothetical protein [Oceaniferula flavus]